MGCWLVLLDRRVWWSRLLRDRSHRHWMQTLALLASRDAFQPDSRSQSRRKQVSKREGGAGQTHAKGPAKAA